MDKAPLQELAQGLMWQAFCSPLMLGREGEEKRDALGGIIGSQM